MENDEYEASSDSTPFSTRTPSTNQDQESEKIKSDSSYCEQTSNSGSSKSIALAQTNNVYRLAESKQKQTIIEHDHLSDPLCMIKLEDLLHLKDSTRKLLNLIEDIQSKTHSKNEAEEIKTCQEPVATLAACFNIKSDSYENTDHPLKKLEHKTKRLNAIYIDVEDTDCSVYKRLTRKCICLNRVDFNDFMIHFNESVKHFTTNVGEIIKNMRILKKFLYMGGIYTKNALLFLVEGFSDGTHSERVEMIHGCSHADICNVFDEQSIVITCVSWPCKYPEYGDATTQLYAARFILKLSQLEEGRRYLNFSSKIAGDIKKVLRKKASKLNFETLEALNATMNNLHKSINEHGNVDYYCKPDNGMSSSIINSLLQYHQYMTLDEVFVHLNLLHNLSSRDSEKKQFNMRLPIILVMFKRLLMEYDDSKINIIVINILNNIVSSKMIEGNINGINSVSTDASTEPTEMKSVTEQCPSKKHITKSYKNKFNLRTSLLKPKGKGRAKENSVIVVPLEKNK